MMQERRFSVGQVIFAEGDASDEAFIIRQGRVEILKDSPKGPVRLAVLGEGDVFGEMGLLDERPRSASARALEEVVTDALGKSDFTKLILERPDQALDLLRALFERLRSANQMVMERAGPAQKAGSPMPRVRIYPLTLEAEAAIPKDGLPVTRFPYRIGRMPDSEDSKVLAMNDIEIEDEEPFIVSLNHFSLDLGPDGVVVRDRGSSRGTIVNGTQLGMLAAHDVAALNQGDNQVQIGAGVFGAGAKSLHYRFMIVVE